MSRTKGSIMLDPNDPFDALLIPIVALNKRKRADYAVPGDLYINFRRNAMMMDLEEFTPVEDCLSMVTRKLGRLVNLRGRDAANETVLDTVEDLIVYAILLKGLMVEEAIQNAHEASR